MEEHCLQCAASGSSDNQTVIYRIGIQSRGGWDSVKKLVRMYGLQQKKSPTVNCEKTPIIGAKVESSSIMMRKKWGIFNKNIQFSYVLVRVKFPK